MSNTPAINRYEEIDVFGNPILVAVTADGGQYFSPRHVCDAIGVSWQGQHVKIKNTKRFLTTVKNILTMRSDGSEINSLMLPAEKLSGWLLSINPNRCKPEVRPALEKYANEADAVLDAWFRKGVRESVQNGDATEETLAKLQKAMNKATGVIEEHKHAINEEAAQADLLTNRYAMT